MANRKTGEVVIEVEGQTYRLVLDMNALCELETVLSQPDQIVTFTEALQKAGLGSAFHIRAVMWAALREHHAEMSIKDVGVWITKVGLVNLSKHIGSMAATAVPDEQDAKDLGLKKQRPRRAQGA